MKTEYAQKLFSPIEETRPCGPELEYDVDYIELQVVATERSEQQFGNTIFPAQQPDWSDVAQRALDLLNRTKDLRILAYLARARAELDGLPGYAGVLDIALFWLEQHWDDLYPRILVEGEEDPLLRINAIAALTEIDGIGRALRRAPLVRGEFGCIKLRELESRLDGTPLESVPWNDAQLYQILRSQDGTELRAVGRITATLSKLNQLIEQHLGQSWTLDFSTFARPFQLIIQAMEQHDEVPLATETAPATSLLADAAAISAGAKPPEREQVIRLMEDICRYFERHEPGHPAALLVRRAQRLMPLNFMEIIQDMAPDSHQLFEQIVGLRMATK